MKQFVPVAVIALVALCSALPLPSTAAQTKAGSNPLQAGPTLEETTAFIKKNLDEDIGGGNKLVSEFTGACTVVSRIYSAGANDPSEKKHLILFELYTADLKDVSNVEVSHNPFNDKIYLRLKTDNNVGRWITRYNKGGFYTRYTEGSSPLERESVLLLCVKAEKAETTRRAVEHAVSLCGGSVQKDDLF